MMYLFTLIYDVLVYSQIIHSTNPNPIPIRLHAHLTLLHMYYPWNQIKSILLLNIRITKQTDPNPNLSSQQLR